MLMGPNSVKNSVFYQKDAIKTNDIKLLNANKNLFWANSSSDADKPQGPISQSRFRENSECVHPEMRETLGF